MTATATIRRVGEIVSVSDPKFPGHWKIVKVNPTTYKLESLHGGGLLRASHALVTDADGTKPGDNPALTQLRALQHPTRPVGIRLGSFVRSSSKPGLFVVIADKFTTINCAPACGDPDHPLRYWRFPAATLTVVDAADVLKV